MNGLLKRIKNRIISGFYSTYRKEILVLGDSHISVFSNNILKKSFPNIYFNKVKIPGATASGLENPNSGTQAHKHFMHALKKYKGEHVIIMLGEVDNGIVIWYRAKKYNTSIDTMLDKSINAYQDFITRVNQSFKPVIISAPLPTIKDGQVEGNIAKIRQEVTLSQRERTDMTIEFNRRINFFCSQAGITYINLDNESLGDNGLVNDRLLNKCLNNHHYDDDTHASMITNHIKNFIS